MKFFIDESQRGRSSLNNEITNHTKLSYHTLNYRLGAVSDFYSVVCLFWSLTETVTIRLKSKTIQ